MYLEKLKSTANTRFHADYGNTETALVNGVTFTFVTTIGTTAGNVLRGVSEAATMAALVASSHTRTTTATE